MNKSAAVHTRVKEDKFHERRLEMQRPVNVRYGFTRVAKEEKPKEFCSRCEREISGGGIKIDGILYHNDCFVAQCKR